MPQADLRILLKQQTIVKKKKIKFFSLSGFEKRNTLNTLSLNKFHINSKRYNQVEVLQSIILLLTIDYIKNKI